MCHKREEPEDSKKKPNGYIKTPETIYRSANTLTARDCEEAESRGDILVTF